MKGFMYIPQFIAGIKMEKMIHSHTTIANSNMEETEIELVVHEIKQTRI